MRHLTASWHECFNRAHRERRYGHKANATTILWMIVLVTMAGAPSTSAAQSAPGPFARCAACHTAKAGARSGLGPNLNGVVGRKAGSVPGFNYSAALKSKPFVWTPQQLDAFLAKPTATVPGTKMIFGGISDPRDRKAIIDFLGRR